MALKRYRIDGFSGLDQSMDENRISPSCSPDAANVSTDGGRLSLAHGFIKLLPDPVPGTDRIRHLTYYRSNTAQYPVVIAGSTVYAYKDMSWQSLYTIQGSLSGAEFDSVMAQIGTADCLIIADGIHPLIKYDGESVSQFGSEEGCSDMPISYLAMYRGRLFAAGDGENPNRLYYSVLPGDGRSIDNWGYIEASPAVEGGHAEVGTSGGDPIIGIAALSNQLLIFKRSSLYRLIGDRPSNFTIEHIDASYRSARQHAITAYGDVLFFLTSSGLYYYNGVTARPSADIFRIKKLMRDALIVSSHVVTVGDKLYFNIRQGREDMLVEYDILERKYLLHRGFSIGCMASVNGWLLFTNGSGYIYRFGIGYSYDGEMIDAYWTTPLTDLGDKGTIKSLRKLYLRGSGGKVNVTTLAGVHLNTYNRRMPSGEEEVLEIPLADEGRTIQLVISNDEGGALELVGGLELLISERCGTE